jgi:hypothetical protein
LKAGRWREAERVCSQFDDRVPETVTWRHGPWLYMLLGQGRVREAHAIVDVLREDTADADVQFGAEMLVRAGELADLEERRDQARDLFRRGLELSRGTDDHYFTSQACASGIRVERRRIESTAGPRGAGAEIQRARQVADQLIAGHATSPHGSPRTASPCCPNPPRGYRPQRASTPPSGDRTPPKSGPISPPPGKGSVSPTPSQWRTTGKPTHCFATTATEAGHGIARTRHWTSRSASAPAPLKAEILQLAQRARLDLELTPPHQPEPAAGRLSHESSTGDGDSLAWCGVGDREDHRVGYHFVAADRDQLMLTAPRKAPPPAPHAGRPRKTERLHTSPAGHPIDHHVAERPDRSCTEISLGARGHGH